MDHESLRRCWRDCADCKHCDPNPTQTVSVEVETPCSKCFDDPAHPNWERRGATPGAVAYDCDNDQWYFRGNPTHGQTVMDHIIDLEHDIMLLNLALFHVENGLSHPDENVRRLIEASIKSNKSSSRDSAAAGES